MQDKNGFQFIERPGEDPWFSPWHRKFRFYFGADLDGRAEMSIRFDEIPHVRKSVKIFGLSAIYPAMLWPLTARRVQRYSLGAWPSFAHENSYRVIAHLIPAGPRRPGRIRFATYSYIDARGGRGPKNQRKPESRFLGEVEVGETARLRIEAKPEAVLYSSFMPGELDQPEPSHSYRERLECRPWFWWRHFAHSRGVTPDTRARIVFTAWR